MNINLRLKEAYPIALLITLLMTYALVGISKPADTFVPLQWSQITKKADTKYSCKHNPLPFLNNLYCEDTQVRSTISPVIQESDFRGLLSQVERKTQSHKP